MAASHPSRPHGRGGVSPPAAWRDEQLGPLLAVTVHDDARASSLETGWFLHGLHFDCAIQRYVEYALPLLLHTDLASGPTTAREFVSRWAYAPRRRSSHYSSSSAASAHPVEQWGASTIIGDLGDRLGVSPWPSVALADARHRPCRAVCDRSPQRRRPPQGRRWPSGSLRWPVLVLQSAYAWHRCDAQISDRLARRVPRSDLAWLDKAAGGPRLTAGRDRLAPALADRPISSTATLVVFTRASTALRKLAQPPSRARACLRLDRRRAGPARSSIPACGPPPRRLYLDDPAAHVTFADRAADQVAARRRQDHRAPRAPGRSQARDAARPAVRRQHAAAPERPVHRLLRSSVPHRRERLFRGSSDRRRSCSGSPAASGLTQREWAER